MGNEQKLSRLEQKRQQIDQQILAIKARQKQQQRKDDTRRKILIGGAVLKEAQADPEFQQALQAILDKHITRDHDRKLFHWQTGQVDWALLSLVLGLAAAFTLMLLFAV